MYRVVKKKILAAILIGICAMQPLLLASAEDEVSYGKVAPIEEQAEQVKVGKYGMLPIYAKDVAEGTYTIEAESSSPMFKIVDAKLHVSDGSMKADITLSGQGYTKLYEGTAKEASEASIEDYIGYTENEDGLYTYEIEVESLDHPMDLAAFSKRKEQWYDRQVLFDASSLPDGALLVELPDYDLIEEALAFYGQSDGTVDEKEDSSVETETEEEIDAQSTQENIDEDEQSTLQSMIEEDQNAAEVDMEDGEYAIEVDLTGGSGKSTVTSPTLMTVREGAAYAKIEWSSSSYDYMIVGNEKYWNQQDEGGYSTFEIPILSFDTPFTVVADTTAMGTPHEIEYTLTFYSETIGSKSQLPQEAAKKVVYIALVIIVGGGILNHFVNKKKRCV